MIIPLTEVVYDKRARNGTWCTLPYPGHKNGCPNFSDTNKCPQIYVDFNDIPSMKWYAVIHIFDLKKHEEEYLKKDWCKTRKQARCVLYWQKKHMNELRDKAYHFMEDIDGDMVLEIPEACGVNVYATMAKHGLILESITIDLDTVYKIMLVGKNANDLQ